MLILRGTTDLLRVVTSAAGTIDYFINYLETDNTSPNPNVLDIPDPSDGQITTSTTTTVLAAPSSGHRYNVMNQYYYNSHATVAVGLRLERYDGTNARILWQGTLLPNESLVVDELGVPVLMAANGAQKAADTKLAVHLVLAADAVNATTSFADVTGFTYPLLSGHTYAFDCNMFVIDNATTTGARFGVNIGAAPTLLGVGGVAVVTNSATASAFSSGYATAVDTACTGAQTTGPGAEGNVRMSGTIIPSADGTFAIRFQSEVAVAAGVTVRRAGSWLRIWEV